MIKLCGVRTSPYVRHARVALAESGLSRQFEQVTPDTINLSPTLRVPFLIDGDLTLIDSAVIVRCAREQSGQAFLPSVGDHELFALATSVLDTAVNLYLLNIGDSAALAEVATGTSAIAVQPKDLLRAPAGENCCGSERPRPIRAQRFSALLRRAHSSGLLARLRKLSRDDWSVGASQPR